MHKIKIITMFTVGSNFLQFPHPVNSTLLSFKLFSVSTHETSAHSNSITNENNFSVIKYKQNSWA